MRVVMLLDATREVTVIVYVRQSQPLPPNARVTTSASIGDLSICAVSSIPFISDKCK